MGAVDDKRRYFHGLRAFLFFVFEAALSEHWFAEPDERGNVALLCGLPLHPPQRRPAGVTAALDGLKEALAFLATVQHPRREPDHGSNSRSVQPIEARVSICSTWLLVFGGRDSGIGVLTKESGQISLD